MKKNIFYHLMASAVFLAVLTQTSLAAGSAEIRYRQCQAVPSTAEQRECFPAVEKQSEVELVAAEKKERANMVKLEHAGEGSKEAHPVQAFDRAEHTYRAFRTAESHRVLASYGSGNGGGLAAYQTVIEMNIARIKLLSSNSAVP